MGKINKRTKKFIVKRTVLKKRGLLKKKPAYLNKKGPKHQDNEEDVTVTEVEDQPNVATKLDQSPTDEYSEEGFLLALNAPDTETPSSTDFEPYDYDKFVVKQKKKPSKKGKQAEVGKTVLTQQIFSTLIGESETSLPALHQVLYAFEAACANANQSDHPLFDMIEPEVITHIITTCLDQFETLANHHCARPAGQMGRKAGLASSVKQWGLVQSIWQRYLEVLLSLVQASQKEPTLLAAILLAMTSLIPYVASFEGLSRRWLKMVLQLLLVEESNVNQVAYVIVQRMASTLPMPFLGLCIKGVYWAFGQASEALEGRTGDSIVKFLGDCVLDIVNIDAWIGYNHAYVYVRDLALDIQAVIDLPIEEVEECKVVSWGYVRKLRLWSNVIGSLCSSNDESPTMEPLVYPMVQIINNTIRRVGSPRYVPMRLQCIQALMSLTEKTNQYIPVSAPIIDLLRHKTTTMKPKPNKENGDLTSTLTLSSAFVGTRAYQVKLVEAAVPLLLAHLARYSHIVTFPELALLSVMELKKFISTSKDPRLSKPVKILLDKIEDNCRHLTSKRAHLNAGPRDTDAARTWAEAEQAKGTPLSRYYNQWLATAGAHRSKIAKVVSQ